MTASVKPICAGRRQTSGRPLFEEIEHTADVALRIRGESRVQLLIHAALGLAHVMAPEYAGSEATARCRLAVTAEDAESLLVEWLNELVFQAEVQRLIFERFDFVKLEKTALEVDAEGRRFTALGRHVKAVTYHGLSLAETSHGLEATVVFDV